MTDLNIDRARTGLVVIDLQKGIVSQPRQPYTGSDVVRNAGRLAAAFRKNGMPVFLVHVNPGPGTALAVTSDESLVHPGPLPPDWAEIVPELGPDPRDIVITKRQWGAFYGTDLELRLRRGKITTIVLCGISTDIGVESTARFAYEYGFQQIFIEDAMTTQSAEQHEVATKFIFPRIGRVRKTEEILRALA